MKQKAIIGLMILLISIVVVLIFKDMFAPKKQEVNPWVYDLEEFAHVDSAQKCYAESKRFSPSIEELSAICINDENEVFVGGSAKVIHYNQQLTMLGEFAVDGSVKAMTATEAGLYLSLGNHIEVYDVDGQKQDVWSPYNRKSLITSLVVKGDYVFVADAANKLMLKYNTNGELQQTIGQRDSISRPKGFVIPSPYFDVALGRQGEIWAVNSGLHQFEAYNEQGELFSSWKRTSMSWEGFSGCCNPSHIALLSDGSFVTSEKGMVRIKIHNPNGDFKCAVAEPTEFKEGTRGIDLATDSEDNIYAIIPNENQVRIYKRIGE